VWAQTQAKGRGMRPKINNSSGGAIIEYLVVALLVLAALLIFRANFQASMNSLFGSAQGQVNNSAAAISSNPVKALQ